MGNFTPAFTLFSVLLHQYFRLLFPGMGKDKNQVYCLFIQAG
jgi:hypothetical protein